MADIIVSRASPDGLARQSWAFWVRPSFGAISLVLGSFSIERRDRPKGRFRGATPVDRWQSSDERRYNSGLERPTTIPVDVVAEAWAKLPRKTYIGWTAPEHEIPTPTDKGPHHG